MIDTRLTLAGRFSSSVSAVSEARHGVTELLAVAVSGGPDSLALLWLARAAYGEQVRAITVDHGLRLDAMTEAALVASRCETIGVPHTTLIWSGPKPASNLQAAAREARYKLMADWCAANGVRWLLTAHHADDQAETLLMRLARGSGSAGLASIRRRRDLGNGVTLLRPLLDWRRSELAAIVAAAGWTAVDDPSNRATRFDRTQARALLAETPCCALSGWRQRRRISPTPKRRWRGRQRWRGRAAPRCWEVPSSSTLRACPANCSGVCSSE